MLKIGYLENEDGNKRLIYNGEPVEYALKNESTDDTMCIEQVTMAVYGKFTSLENIDVFIATGEQYYPIVTVKHTDDMLTFFPVINAFGSYSSCRTDFKQPIYLPPEHRIGAIINGKIGYADRTTIQLQYYMLSDMDAHRKKPFLKDPPYWP